MELSLLERVFVPYADKPELGSILTTQDLSHLSYYSTREEAMALNPGTPVVTEYWVRSADSYYCAKNIVLDGNKIRDVELFHEMDRGVPVHVKESSRQSALSERQEYLDRVAIAYVTGMLNQCDDVPASWAYAFAEEMWEERQKRLK